MKRLDETKLSETLHETRDVLGRDRDEIRDAQVRDETETLGTLVETRRLETETSRLRPHPCNSVTVNLLQLSCLAYPLLTQCPSALLPSSPLLTAARQCTVWSKDDKQ